jgi:hypothetical protein
MAESDKTIKTSILKRPTTAYLQTHPEEQAPSNDNAAVKKSVCIRASPPLNTTANTKNVRFSGIEKSTKQRETSAKSVSLMQQQPQQKHAQIVETRDDYYELERVVDDEKNQKKYYKKSKSIPCKQIKLIGLNEEFIVASQPIQKHIQRELIQQQHMQQQRSISSGKSGRARSAAPSRPLSEIQHHTTKYPNIFSKTILFQML